MEKYIPAYTPKYHGSWWYLYLFHSSISFWMKTFGISMTATPLYSFEYMVQLSSMDSVDKFGDLESYLFPPATVCPLILPYLFCFRNMWDSNTIILLVLSSYFQWIGLNVFLKWSFFILECTLSWALVTHYLNPSLSESCVKHSVMMTGCSSCIWMKNICESGWSATWSSNCSISPTHLETVMLVILYVFVWKFTLEYLRTPRIYFRSSGLCPGLCGVIWFPALVIFWWVLLLRGPILLWRVVEWFGPFDRGIPPLYPLDSEHFYFRF